MSTCFAGTTVLIIIFASERLFVKERAVFLHQWWEQKVKRISTKGDEGDTVCSVPILVEALLKTFQPHKIRMKNKQGCCDVPDQLCIEFRKTPSELRQQLWSSLAWMYLVRKASSLIVAGRCVESTSRSRPQDRVWVPSNVDLHSYLRCCWLHTVYISMSLQSCIEGAWGYSDLEGAPLACAAHCRCRSRSCNTSICSRHTVLRGQRLYQLPPQRLLCNFLLFDSHVSRNLFLKRFAWYISLTCLDRFESLWAATWTRILEHRTWLLICSTWVQMRLPKLHKEGRGRGDKEQTLSRGAGEGKALRGSFQNWAKVNSLSKAML